MSKYSNCALFVDGNGKYCCRDKVFTVGKHPVSVTNANCEPVELILYPTGDTDDVGIPSGVIAGPGMTILSLPGKYRLPCPEGLEGELAPEDPLLQKALCCCEIKTSLDPLILQKLCELVDQGGGDSSTLTQLLEKLCELLGGEDGSAIEKLCEIVTTLTGPEGSTIEKLCDILTASESILESNTTWCTADAVWQAAMLVCMEQLKANTANIVGIETSLGQIGCTEDAEGNITGSVLVCKHTLPDETQEIKVWWFGLDGTVVEDYTGEYVACTNLKILENILDSVLECLEAMKEHPIAAHEACFLGEPTERKVGYDVSDFDSGDLEVGDPTSVDFNISLDTGCTVKSVTVAGAPAGSTVVVGAVGQYKLEFNYDGTQPNWPLTAIITCDGVDAVLTGDDFYIASGGGETKLLEFATHVALKEYCYPDGTVKFFDAAGEEVDTTELTRCVDVNVQTSGTILCDYLEDGSKVDFFCQQIAKFGVDGAILSVERNNYQLDKVTPYTPVGRVGVCVDTQPMCVESQEWTYGIDNTGTQTNFDAILCITNSDGSTVEVVQTDQGAASQWTPQMAEWGANLQAAVDAAGIKWFVETRYIVADETNLSGGGGFAGPPSIPVAKALYDGGMRARYLNIQICPGQPVPVNAVWKQLDGPDGAVVRELAMTTAGAVLGPLNKFWLCPECGKAPLWYLEDGVTLAEPGQIPNCWEPCGTLALTSAPPDRDCEFFFAEACDNVGEPDVDTNWVNLVTRRATVCGGEQIQVDYFVPDPADATSLIEYTLVGDFVDCDTGEPLPLPLPPCDDFEIATLWAIENKTPGLRRREWVTTDPTFPFGTDEPALDYLRAFDRSQPTTVDEIVTNNTGALNDTANTAAVLDIEERVGCICVTEAFDMRWSTSSEGAILVEIGYCKGPLEEVMWFPKGTGAAATPVVHFPVGIHKIRLTNMDSGGSNSSWTAQSTQDGVDFVNDNNMLDDMVSTTIPREVCKKVKVCKPSGELIDLLKGLQVDPADCYACEVGCSPPPAGRLEIV